MKMPGGKALRANFSLVAMTVGFVLSAVIGWLTGSRMLAAYNQRATTGQVTSELHMLAGASQNFYELFERWPMNLTELTNNSRGISIYVGSLSDPWGRPYVYFQPTRFGAGEIGTFGIDGQKYGNRSDGDTSIAFKQKAPTPRREISLTWRQPPPR